MLISIKELEYCKISVDCEIDGQDVETKKEEAFGYFKNSNVPGFRTGKATADAIRNHFRSKINDIAKSELATSSYHNVIAEKGIRPFGQPSFTSAQLDGSKFKCNFCVNTIPNVELKQYKDFELPKGNMPNAVEMAEKILQKVRVDHGDTVPFLDTDVAQMDDEVIINYSGYVKGKEEPVVKIEGEIIQIGKSHLEAVNENLVGMKPGEKREFTSVMPSDSNLAELVGQEVTFIVELAMGKKTNPAPLSDELAQKVGIKDMQELMHTVHGVATARVQEVEKKYLSDQIAARLIELHDIRIPSWLSEFEAKLLLKQNGHDWDSLGEETRGQFIEIAIRNVKLSIILDKIREDEPDAQLSDEEVIKTIQSNVHKYKTSMHGMAGKTDREVLETIQKTGFMPALISHIKDDFTMDFIIKNSKIIE